MKMQCCVPFCDNTSTPEMKGITFHRTIVSLNLKEGEKRSHLRITMQHTNMIKQATKQFKCNLVSTTLGPDHCDLYIYQCDEDQQPELEEMIEDVATVVKDEEGWSSTSIADDMDAINPNIDNNVSNEEEDNKTSLRIMLDLDNLGEGLQRKKGVSSEQMAETLNSLKRESASFTCTRCSEEFEQENAYYEHVSNHLQNTDNYSGCDSIQESKPRAALSRDELHHENKRGMQRLRAGLPLLTKVLRQDLVTQLSENAVQATEACAINESKQIIDIKTEEMNSASSHSDTETHTDISRFTNCAVLSNDTNKKPIKAVSDEYPQKSNRKPYTCDTCDYKCTKKSSVITHMIIHTDKNSYSCDICSYNCARKDNLARHKLTHAGVKPYTCEICNYKCMQKKNLTTHILNHTAERPYSCDTCDYRCTKRSYLVAHVKIHSDRKPYSCRICDFKCRHKNSFRVHMRIHSGEKPYTCDVCDHKCATNTALSRYKVTHAGDKPYSCEICSNKFTLKHNLLEHIKIHNGDKPYSCDECDYTCARKSNMASHKRKHSGKKPYSCAICSFKCRHNSSLTNHMKTHTGEKPYSCDICDYKSKSKSHLNRHKLTHSNK